MYPCLYAVFNSMPFHVMNGVTLDIFCNSPANIAVITLVSDIESPDIMGNVVRNTGYLCDGRSSQGRASATLMMFRRSRSSSGSQSLFQAVHPAYCSVYTVVLSEGYTGRGVKLTTHIRQVRKSRMLVAEPELPTMFSWRDRYNFTCE